MDSKETFIKDVSVNLLSNFTPDEITIISNQLITSLAEYSLTKISNELITYDYQNENLIKMYCACLKLDGKSDRTIQAYVYEINRFLKVIPKVLTDVDTMDIRRYLAYHLQSGKSKRYIDNCRCYLASFYGWLSRENKIDINPIDNIKKIKYERVIKQPFTDIELDKIRSTNLSLRDRALIELLISSGVRVAELCKLDISDIDFQSLKVTVRCGKGGKDRITYMSRVACHHLKEYLNTRTDDSQSLFLTYPDRDVVYQSRMKPHSVELILKAISEKSGVKNIHPHKFRRTFATTLYNKGMPVNEIQKLLGHSNINTTLIYITTNEQAIQQSYMKHIV